MGFVAIDTPRMVISVCWLALILRLWELTQLCDQGSFRFIDLPFDLDPDDAWENTGNTIYGKIQEHAGVMKLTARSLLHVHIPGCETLLVKLVCSSCTTTIPKQQILSNLIVIQKIFTLARGVLCQTPVKSCLA